MKELEHVLQRVRVRLQDGRETKLRERVYAVLRVLGAATLSGAPERGCQLSIEEIGRRSFKQRSTVLAALAEARQLGLLTRHAPASGAAWPTHINIFSIRLVEAAQKSRPYLGPPLIFDGPDTLPKNTQKNAAGETRKMQKIEDLQGFQEGSGAQLLDVHYLDPEVIFKLAPPPPPFFCCPILMPPCLRLFLPPLQGGRGVIPLFFPLFLASGQPNFHCYSVFLTSSKFFRTSWKKTTSGW